VATDYILFIHGVNTREERDNPTYADELFKNIMFKAQGLTFSTKSLYWGDIAARTEEKLLKTLKESDEWKKLWFQSFREHQLLQFAGDAALYLSRYVGYQVIVALAQQANEILKATKPGDRLHLVTHSMGTVIFFDALFATRWDGDEYPAVKQVRDSLFGVEPNPAQGIALSSIHTMGSPVAFFSLIDVKGAPDLPQDQMLNIPNTHDITPRLEILLKSLHDKLHTKLPWRNFIHPGDPVAYPLAKLIPEMVDSNEQYLDIKDVLTHKAELFDFLTEPVSQTALSLLHGGDAHGSYWHSNEVAEIIAQTIRQAAKQPVV
jgi:hypothetical protein